MADLEFYSRDQWGARPSKPGIVEMKYPVDEVFIHHEGGAVWTSTSIDEEMAKMRELQAFAQAGVYSDIPYGLAAFPSGRCYEGRDLRLEGAATIGENADSIGVLVVGNYEIQAPAWSTINAAAEVIKLAQFTGRVTANATVLGHRDAPQASTACPGKFLYEKLPDLRGLVVNATPNPKPQTEPEPEMVLYTCPAKPAILLSGGKGVLLKKPATFDRHRAAGIPEIELDPADYPRFLKAFRVMR